MALAASLPSLFAQNEDAVTFHTFCVNLDGYVGGIFYDYRGEKIAITANNVGLSGPYQSPPGGLVSLYRELPPVAPETKPRRVPVAEARLGSGGPWLLILSSTRNAAAPEQPAISALAIDHSWEKHPVGMVRVFNFCPAVSAFQIVENAFELRPGEDQVVPFPNTELAQLFVKVAVKKDGQWRLQINRPQRIPPADALVRLSWVLMEVPPDEDNPEPRYLIRNLLENVPAPLSPRP